MKPVWQERTLDELAALGELDAIQTHFAGRNGRVLFRLLLVAALFSAFAVLVLLAEGEHWRLAFPVVNLVLVRVLFLTRERKAFNRHFRGILVGYLVAQVLLLMGVYFDPDVVAWPVDFMLPALLLLFRLQAAQTALPLLVIWAMTAGRNLIMAALGRAELSLGLLIGQSVIVLFVLFVTARLSRRRYRDFLLQWRREHGRLRERSRMREELDDARRIQLSMLPRSDPSLDWLEVAGISIPASEVGGDYYDYFPVDDHHFSVVVADVAGHGVASGLLLSGIRSCLYLLRDDPLSPKAILEKLDRMVRDTTGKRAFVTMCFTTFHATQRTLTFSAAAHPAILRRPAGTDDVEELELHALPLGTALPSRIEEVTVPYSPDDVFVLVTDGVAETNNAAGDVYGTERLNERLRKTPMDRSARDIRDFLLGDLCAFKGDAPQLDDVTVLVVKVR